jgi:hypothetical protein
MIKRVLLQSISPVITINKNGDEWHMAAKAALKNTAFKFQMGEEFDGTNFVDAKVKNIITEDGNKWTQVQTPVDGKQVVTTVCEFGEKQLTATMTVENVTAVRIYERL